MAFFCYERNFANVWCPVLFSARPGKAMSKETEPDRTPLIEVPDEWALQACVLRYPAPAEKEEPNAQDAQEI